MKIETERQAREYVDAASKTEIGRNLLVAAGYQPEAVAMVECDPVTVRRHMLRVANTVHEMMAILAGEPMAVVGID
jgi:hypothetical protein